MSLVNVTAKFECDECGRVMEAWLDESYTPPNGWSVFDIAEDRLRGGCGIGLEMTSVQNGRHLCANCTKIEDAKYPEETPNEKLTLTAAPFAAGQATKGSEG